MTGSLVVFSLLRLLSGDIASIMLGTSARPESVAALRADLGLDQPWLVQYLEWLGGLARGDLGTSYGSQYDIAGEISARLGVTVTLAIVSMVVSGVCALVAGTYAAMYARNARGEMVNIFMQLGVALPTFWVGLLLIGFFSIELGWLPAGGYVPWSESALGAVKSLILPSVALAVPLAAVFTRYVRSAMLEVLSEDYIHTAMAKGRTLGGAVLTHGIRNASLSLVTVGTLQLGGLIAGAVVVENVFTLPGLGSLLISALNGREALVVQSVVFVILLIVLALNFAMDVSYGLLDPRIRAAETRGTYG